MNYSKEHIARKRKRLSSVGARFESTFRATLIKIAIFGVIFVGICGCSLGFGMVAGILESTPEIDLINVSPTKFATKIYDNQGHEIETLIAEGSNRVYVPLDQIPDNLKNAFIAVEDERFYTHNGIDMKGIGRAAYVAFSSGDLSQGASTITQQLIKNTVFEAYNETTLEKIKRKLQEQYLAINLDESMGKDAILENYLNIINLGNGNLGVQAAANNYFNKDVSELTLSECAVIAGITKNPSGYNPVKHPDKNRDRQEIVLLDMYEQGYITKEQYEEALNDKVYDRIQDIHLVTGGNSVYTYYTDALIEVLLHDLQEQLGYSENQATTLLYSGGLSIHTAQDSTMQKIAEDILNDPKNYPENTQYSISLNLTVVDQEKKSRYYTHQNMLRYFQEVVGDKNYELLYSDEEEASAAIEEYKKYLEETMGYEIIYESEYYVIQPQISFTLMDQHTGEVKVIVGGRGEKETSRSMNRATNTYRSPGSTIKPLVTYGPALDTGTATLATVYDDCPYYYSDGGQLVTNWDKKYRGLMTMREALYRSQNVPAVKCLASITPSVGVEYLVNFGISSVVTPENAINGLHDAVESVTLGGMTLGVYNIDMCAAYATYANEGVYTKPVYYTKVYDHDGNLLLDNTTPDTRQVVKSSTAWLMTNAMTSVITQGTGGKARVAGMDVAGKTGTSNSDGDLWFVGYTPYYTAAIWTGYDDDASRSVYKKVDHTALWGEIMNKIHEELPNATFPSMPDDVVQLTVCSQSGMLPGEYCSMDERGELFITEYFAKDNQPEETCTAHGLYNICAETGKLSVGTCPATVRVMVRRPPNNTKVPEDLSAYEGKVDFTVPDAAWTVDYELATAVCPVHGAWYLEALGITPNTESPGIDEIEGLTDELLQNGISGGGGDEDE
ncbi:MAG: PBP1A family penicillin-binding protein [Lachnospiraceae bacterium]|nr:PBP1A family penicillin-binding protein [Lachnospiraceae bacterium]